MQCQTYDVTSLLRKGRNTIGVILGNGWMRRRMARVRGRWLYGDTLKVKACLTVILASGKTVEVDTDGSWLTVDSPITMTDIYDGETYDARLWQKGWDKPGTELKES